MTRAGTCPSCHGRGSILVVLPNDEDEDAECLTCNGTGLLPVVCAQCGHELFRSLTGTWAHEEPVHNNHIPRTDSRD